MAVLGLSAAAAQDLAITNARIIDGTGSFVRNGIVLISDGQIETVTASYEGALHGELVNAKGMTLLSGFIDTHRHDLVDGLAAATSDADLALALETEVPRNLRILFEEGFTTVMVPAFDVATAIEIRRRSHRGYAEQCIDLQWERRRDARDLRGRKFPCILERAWSPATTGSKQHQKSNRIARCPAYNLLARNR